MRKRYIKSIAHWVIMSVLLLFPVLMVGISSFAGQEQTINVEESYEYETNEVNSIDDLVEGNIYKVSFNLQDYDSNTYGIIGGYYFKFDTSEIKYNTSSNDVLYFSVLLSPYQLRVELNNVTTARYFPTSTVVTGYVVYYYHNDSIFPYTNFSISDYLGEHSLDYTIENETMREDINQWCSSFRNLPVNQWYGEMLDTIGLGITNSMMMNVIYTYPLYVLWVYIIDLVVDCLLVIINFGHNALKRLGGDNE